MNFADMKCNPLVKKKKLLNGNVREHKFGINANIANFVRLWKLWLLQK